MPTRAEVPLLRIRAVNRAPTRADGDFVYALDGRDPNSYSGIFWVLGRYDRAWGPERPIFGKVRYMSSDATKRKLRMRDYLTRWSGS